MWILSDQPKDGSYDDGKLIIVTDSQVIAIQLHRCHNDKITSCRWVCYVSPLSFFEVLVSMFFFRRTFIIAGMCCPKTAIVNVSTTFILFFLLAMQNMHGTVGRTSGFLDGRRKKYCHINIIIAMAALCSCCSCRCTFMVHGEVDDVATFNLF